jgi:uncharacterized protein
MVPGKGKSLVLCKAFSYVWRINKVRDAIMEMTNIENGGEMMVSQVEILAILSENLDKWKEMYGVQRIGLFGSYSRGEEKDSSDIDLIVEFSTSHLSFDNYMDLKFFLEDTFQKPVDLVIINDIKPALKPVILEDVKYA